MRILHVIGNSEFGGSSIIVISLASMAERNGWTADVLTTNARFQREVTAVGLRYVNLPVIWRDVRPLRDIAGMYRLYRYLIRERYDAVHTHTSKGGFVGRIAARLAGVPIVVHTVHGFAFHEESPVLKKTAYVALERIAARFCDKLITVSEFHRKWAIELGIAGEDKITAICNGIPDKRVRADESPDAARRDLGLPPDAAIVLNLGRLAEEKGLEDLFHAAAAIRHRTPRPLTVVLAGDGPLRKTLEKLAASLHIQDIVRFLGFCPDISKVLAAADVVALPSLREGLSIALLECMAAGKAIICTSIGSNAEVCGPNNAAIQIPTCRPDLLGEEVLRVLANPHLAAQLGANARETYLSRYTEELMLAAYANQYRMAGSARLNPETAKAVAQ